MTLDPERITSMSHNARSFTLEKAPDSKQTYNTILHQDALSPAFGENPSFADVV
jgi:hypothetical protein